MAEQHTSAGNLLRAWMHVATDSRIKAAMATLHAQAHARALGTTVTMETIETELAPYVEDAVRAITESDSFPAELRPVFDGALHMEHQAQSIIVGVVVFSVVNAVVMALVDPLVQDVRNELWSLHTSIPLSPAEAALGVLRGNITQGEGASEAAKTGISGGHFQTLIDNTGEPPAIQEMLFLWRRGLVGEGDVIRAIRQSRVRNEWVNAVLALRVGPPGAATAIAAAVQGHLDDATASRIVEENGIDPANYQWLFDTAGRPPGPQELLHLLNRNVIDEATVIQAIRESDIKNKYIPAILELRHQLMPQRTVVSAVRQGVLDAGTALAKLQQIGFSPADAATLVAEASVQKVAKGKDVSESQTLTAYRDRYIDAATTTTDLLNLGYDAAEAEFLIGLADHERVWREQQHVVAAVRSQYVRHHITAADVSTRLGAAGVPGAAIAEYITFWDIERQVTTKDLTLAQLSAAHKRGLIDDLTMARRLVGMGYSDVDAAILVTLATPAPTTGTTP